MTAPAAYFLQLLKGSYLFFIFFTTSGLLCFCRNAHRYGAVFSEAERLFERLETVRLSWRRWVALGGFSLEELASEHLEKAEDWDLNFRGSKNLGQEIAKLPWLVFVLIEKISSSLDFF